MTLTEAMEEETPRKRSSGRRKCSNCAHFKDSDIGEKECWIVSLACINDSSRPWFKPKEEG